MILVPFFIAFFLQKQSFFKKFYTLFSLTFVDPDKVVSEFLPGTLNNHFFHGRLVKQPFSM